MSRQQRGRQDGYRLALPIGLGLFVLACSSEVSGPDDSGGVDPPAASLTDASGGSLSAAGGTGAAIGSSSSGGAGVGDVTNCATDASDTAPTVLRRLSALEYQFTVQDLLQLAEPPSAEGIPLDTERLGFRTFAEYQTMSAENLRAYLDKGASLAAELLESPQRRDAVLGCDTSETECLSEFVTRFGKVAYRRPLEVAEVDVIVSAAGEFSASEEDAFAFAIETFLSSANFLYRVEIGDNPEGLSTLTPHQLTSRLSFALWGRGPSAEQLDAALTGSLDSAEGLRSVAQSMLQDERAQLFFEAFFRQWLGYQTLRPATPEHEAVAGDMQEETDRVLAEFAWGAGDFLKVLTTNHSYVSPELADFYGLEAPDADGLIEFAADDPRFASGLLTHAALLSAKSDGDMISIRGNWLRKTFLCQELQIPANLVDTIGELLVGLDRVGIVEERNTRVSCVTCHSKIDPIGVGLFKFDRSGAFNSEEDISVFGITPALPDAPEPNTFENIGELSSQLVSMPDVPTCLTERAYLYMNGREPSSEDSCSVERVSEEFVGEGQDFRALLHGIVEDPAFRLRRPPTLSP